MIMRALILLGWKKSDQPGPNPVAAVYCGLDGAELAVAHKAAQESGEYVAFRKIINPPGIPMPMTVDPKPKPPVFPNEKPAPHEPVLAKKLEAAEQKHIAEVVKPEAEKRAAAKKAEAEQQAIVDAAEASFKEAKKKKN